MPSGSISQNAQRPEEENRHAADLAYDSEMAAQFEPAFAVVPGRAISDPRLTPFQFRIFALMCGYANRKDRICWPKQETLAKILHTNVQVISKNIAKLVQFRYVEIGKSGYPARNVYRILWDAPLDKPLAECLPATELSPQTSQSCLPRQVRVVSPDKSVLYGKNRPLEQTMKTPVVQSDLSRTSLAPLARTRERFDASALRRDPLFIALSEHLAAPETEGAWRQWATMINRLRQAGATAADIPQAIKGHRLLMPNALLTLPSIERHWAEIREGKTREQLQLAITRRSQELHRGTTDDSDRQRKDEQEREVKRLLLEYGYADDTGNIARG